MNKSTNYDTRFYRRNENSKVPGPEHYCSCRHVIEVNEYFVRAPVRERVLSNHEACHAGTLYPVRGYQTLCTSCMTSKMKTKLAKAIERSKK